MKRQITITVYAHGQTNQNAPIGLIEYIAWLQTKLQEIPEEHRHTARTNIYATESYGMGVLCYSIEYDRPETDDEEAARQRKEQQAEQAKQQQERAQLAALRAKYDPQ